MELEMAHQRDCETDAVRAPIHAAAPHGNGWSEWQDHVLGLLKEQRDDFRRHSEAFQQHIRDDVVCMGGIRGEVHRIHRKIAYFTGFISALIAVGHGVAKLVDWWISLP
jgi:hypothetical protein